MGFYKAYYYLLKNGSENFLLLYCSNSKENLEKLAKLKYLNNKYINKSYKIIEKNNKWQNNMYNEILKRKSIYPKL